MYNFKKVRTWIFVLLFAMGFILIQSCAGVRGYGVPPVTVPEIVKMSKEGVPAQDIIKKMKK